ncbi:hypothetical protein RHMOL_Rhmol13G0029100 [Rhododendron molle]|uniref:Uncharacterized protein n=1 Tax=Rhododendron molle TaxID=49168 RepID=A0ACC0L3S6_RHOML|nr:hypothetical protein RHMOL_Rhmol13G0029100 [Rhododendron molle]
MANSLMLLSRVGAAASGMFAWKMCNRKFPSFQALDNGRRLPPCSGAEKAKDARVLYLRAGVHAGWSSR